MTYMLRIVEAVTVLGAVSGTAYYALCLWGVARFLNEVEPVASDSYMPPVSILKPLKGADPGIYEAFRSHCQQEYPQYELVFGVADFADPAVAAVQQLQKDFPNHRIKLV